jgi:ParB-like chromosome segregation protein Spo0J
MAAITKPGPTQPRVVRETRKLSELRPHPRNARKHPPEQIVQLVGILREFGWTNAAAVIDEDDFILDGHARCEAGPLAGLHEGPVVQFFGLTDQQKRRLMLADNRIALNSTWDVDALRAEITELRGDGTDLEALGFTAAELDRLAPAELEAQVEAVDVSTVQDRFWISVRGPLSSQALALQRLKELMADLPGVTVEQGTVALDG